MRGVLSVVAFLEIKYRNSTPEAPLYTNGCLNTYTNGCRLIASFDTLFPGCMLRVRPPRVPLMAGSGL